MQSSMRGHRVLWAAFNMSLGDMAYCTGGLVHKNSDATALTKADLQRLVQSRDDLVHQFTSWGAQIATTSMHWKKESHNLEWIVRHMSWLAPWVIPRNNEKNNLFL